MIYRIINISNGKSYIGQSTNIKKRLKQHFSNLKCGRHENDHLQKSYNKYGHSSFKIEILEKAENLSIEELNNREVFWIKHYNSYIDGYNLTSGGDGTTGRVFSEEERKMRALKMTGSNNSFLEKNILLKFASVYRNSLHLKSDPRTAFMEKLIVRIGKRSEGCFIKRKKKKAGSLQTRGCLNLSKQ